MIYDKLDIIPLKLFLEVLNTANVSLLTDEQNKLQLTRLNVIWEKLQTEYEQLGLSNNANQLLKLTTRIEALKIKHDSIQLALDALRFDVDIDLMNELNNLGYKINQKTYFDDIERIERESKSLLVKIKRLEQKLPKSDGKTNATTIDKVILGYCAITGLQFDTNRITVTQFHSLKELAEEKIKVLEQQASNAKKKK